MAADMDGHLKECTHRLSRGDEAEDRTGHDRILNGHFCLPVSVTYNVELTGSQQPAAQKENSQVAVARSAARFAHMRSKEISGLEVGLVVRRRLSCADGIAAV